MIFEKKYFFPVSSSENLIFSYFLGILEPNGLFSRVDEVKLYLYTNSQLVRTKPR